LANCNQLNKRFLNSGGEISSVKGFHQTTAQKPDDSFLPPCTTYLKDTMRPSLPVSNFKDNATTEVKCAELSSKPTFAKAVYEPCIINKKSKNIFNSVDLKPG